MKKIGDILKLAGQWLFLTNIGRIILGIVVLVLSQIMQDYSNSKFWFYLFWAATIYLFGYVLLFMVFAWIINPYKDWKAAKAEREKYK